MNVNRAPQQDRSQRTQERILAAMESLLEERDADDITVDAIVERAHLSVGAFYKRFKSKQDLLPFLLSRLHTSALPQLQTELASVEWTRLRLAGRIDGIIDLVAQGHLRQRRLIRACVSSRLLGTLRMSSKDVEDATELMILMQDFLMACREEIRHENPPFAVRVGLYVCLQSLQTALMCEPQPSGIDGNVEGFVAEVKLMLRRYLLGGA